MRSHISTAVLAIVFACTPTLGFGQGDDVSKSPVNVSISASPTARLGSSIVLHIVLRNDSAATQLVPEQRHSGQEGELNYQVFVTYIDGQPVADTNYGAKIRSHSLVRGHGSSMIVRLEPGKEINEDLNVTALVGITSYGTYIVSVERDDPVFRPLHLHSNSLRIRVDP